MNGRVEDAILGRFLSPDPHITDPTNAQNYNRYSYVLNNPLTFRDPTGFDPCVPDGAGFTTCTVGSEGAPAAPGGGFGPSISSPPASILPTRTPSVPGQFYNPSGFNGLPTITAIGSASQASVDFMAAQGAYIVWPSIFAGRVFQSAFNSTFNVLSNTTKLFTNVGNTIPDL